jgi:hypothetical protein
VGGLFRSPFRERFSESEESDGSSDEEEVGGARLPPFLSGVAHAAPNEPILTFLHTSLPAADYR